MSAARPALLLTLTVLATLAAASAAPFEAEAASAAGPLGPIAAAPPPPSMAAVRTGSRLLDPPQPGPQDDGPIVVSGARSLYTLRVDAPASLHQLRREVEGLLARTGAFSPGGQEADGVVSLQESPAGVLLAVRRPGQPERLSRAGGPPLLLAGALADAVLRAFGRDAEFGSLIAWVRGGQSLCLGSPSGVELRAWPSSGDVVAASFAEQGTELVYARATDARRELLRARIDGTEAPRPFLSWAGHASSPLLLAGGQYYFSGATPTGVGLFWGTLGAPPQALFPRRSATLEVSPALDPAHHRLAFVTDRGGQQRIHLSGLDGGGETTLETGLGQALDPAFSPSGDELAYALSERSGEQQVWIADLRTGQRRVVTSGPGKKSHPGFSPGGGLVVYQQRGDGPSQVWTASALGGSEKLLVSTPGGATLPVWGPLRAPAAVARASGW
jgi:hypothetical protein